MRLIHRLPMYGALLFFSSSAFASTVQRCEDASGNITFTAQGCPADQASETREFHSPPPGSVAPSGITRSEAQAGSRRESTELVVVGQRDDGCGNLLTAEARRKAILNKRVVPGMTIQEVENLLGRPAKTRYHKGDLRYEYEDKKQKVTHSISFDANGCVSGKR